MSTQKTTEVLTDEAETLCCQFIELNFVRLPSPYSCLMGAEFVLKMQMTHEDDKRFAEFGKCK